MLVPFSFDQTALGCYSIVVPCVPQCCMLSTFFRSLHDRLVVPCEPQCCMLTTFFWSLHDRLVQACVPQYCMLTTCTFFRSCMIDLSKLAYLNVVCWPPSSGVFMIDLCKLAYLNVVCWSPPSECKCYNHIEICLSTTVYNLMTSFTFSRKVPKSLFKWLSAILTNRNNFSWSLIPGILI